MLARPPAPRDRPVRTRTRRLRWAGPLAVIALAAIASPAVAAPGWTPPRAVFSPSNLGVADPQVAFSGDGSAMAVWGRTDIFTGRFESSVHSATTSSWGALQSSVSSDDWTIGGLHLALDRAGDAVASWGGGHISYSWRNLASRPAGGAWTDADLISGAQRPGSGGVAMDPDGKAIVAWPANNDDADPRTQAALVKVRPLGSAWSPATPLSSMTVASPHDGRFDAADVALDPAGRAVAAWARTLDDVTTVEVAWRPAGGSWSAPHPVATTNVVQSITVRVDASGTATLVWSDSVGNVVASRSGWGTNAWQTPVTLTGAAGGANGDLDLAVDPGGKAIAVWTAYSSIVTAVRPAGGAWMPRQTLSAAPAEAPVVALDAAGNAIVAWERYADDASVDLVEAALRPQGGDWSSPHPLSVPGDRASQPAVAMSPGGDALVVWSDWDLKNSTVAYSAHDVTGPAISAVAVPVTAVPEGTVAVSMSAPSDPWSPVGDVGWDFGDGAGASGPTASHAYASPGTYTVVAHASDALGNVSSQTRQITVLAPAPLAPPTGGTATFAPAGPAGTFGTVGGVIVALPGASTGATPAPAKGGGPAPRRRALRVAVSVPASLQAGVKGVLGVRLNRAVRGAFVRVQLRRGVTYTTIAQGRVSGRRVPVALSFASPGRYLMRIQIREAGRATVGTVTAVLVTRRR